MADEPIRAHGIWESSYEALQKSAIESARRAQEAWDRITEREKIAYEAGRQSRDAEVAALRFQRDLLAERIGAAPPQSRSLEERVHLLEYIVAQAEPALVRRMLDALDVKWMEPPWTRRPPG